MNRKLNKILEWIICLSMLAFCICSLVLFIKMAIELPKKDSAGTYKNTQSARIEHSSDYLIQKIKEREGFSPEAIWDGNHYSYGYGCWAPDYNSTITEEEADKLLRDQLPQFERAVIRFEVENNLNFNQNQFDAMVAFSYNLGYKVFEKYKDEALLQMICTGNYTQDTLTQEWIKYCKVGGVPNDYIKSCRLWEVTLFLSEEEH